VLHVFAPVNVVTPAPHTKAVARRTGLDRRTGESKMCRLRRTFAGRLRRIATRYPDSKYPRVVPTIDNAAWRGGEIVKSAPAEYPHLELKRLPGSSPQLNVIERFRKSLRRRATRNRLFDTVVDLKRSIRNSAATSKPCGFDPSSPTATPHQ